MIFHVLTAVLFLLKVLHVIDVSWWLVLAPSLVMIAIAIFALCITIMTALLKDKQ